MLYALRRQPASPFLVRDAPRPDRDFLDDLREFISLRPGRRNDGPCSPFLVRDRPDSYHTFLDDLREFISLRLDRVDPYRESEEYCLQQEKASRLHDKLLAMLSEEGQATLLAYGEAVCAAHYLEVEMLAERAFLDGVRLILSSFEF